MTIDQITRKIEKQLLQPVYIENKSYTTNHEDMLVNLKYIMEELQLIYKLSNVKNIWFRVSNETKDKYNFIDYSLQVILNFGEYTETVWKTSVTFKDRQKDN